MKVIYSHGFRNFFGFRNCCERGGIAGASTGAGKLPERYALGGRRRSYEGDPVERRRAHAAVQRYCGCPFGRTRRGRCILDGGDDGALTVFVHLLDRKEWGTFLVHYDIHQGLVVSEYFEG